MSPATPGRQPFENDAVKKWIGAIGQSDGFVVVTPEYNYGPAAVLKNALDWVYQEWNRKAVGFVSYGSAMGARSVQQLAKQRLSFSSRRCAPRCTYLSPPWWLTTKAATSRRR